MYAALSSPYPVVSWSSRMQISRFCLHRAITLATSVALFAVHRPPLSTTRTVLAPAALIAANELVCVGYQVCAWLMPRMTKVCPFASTMFRPLTCRPVAA